MKKSPYTHQVCSMRKKIALLINEDPESFAVCIEEYNAWGAKGFPEPVTGTKPKIGRDSYAFLLASYRMALREGITREQFLDNEAEKGIKTGTKYHVWCWRTPDIIKKHLQTAEKIEKESEEFSQRVIFLMLSMRMQNFNRENT